MSVLAVPPDSLGDRCDRYHWQYRCARHGSHDVHEAIGDDGTRYLWRVATADPAAAPLLALVRHVRACPLGWRDGELIVARGTSNRDVLEWLQRLNSLAGVDESVGSRAPIDGQTLERSIDHASLVVVVEEFLSALADRAGDALERHARTSACVARLGELGVRMPQAFLDRQRGSAS